MDSQEILSVENDGEQNQDSEIIVDENASQATEMPTYTEEFVVEPGIEEEIKQEETVREDEQEGVETVEQLVLDGNEGEEVKIEEGVADVAEDEAEIKESLADFTQDEIVTEEPFVDAGDTDLQKEASPQESMVGGDVDMSMDAMVEEDRALAPDDEEKPPDEIAELSALPEGKKTNGWDSFTLVEEVLGDERETTPDIVGDEASGDQITGQNSGQVLASNWPPFRQDVFNKQEVFKPSFTLKKMTNRSSSGSDIKPMGKKFLARKVDEKHIQDAMRVPSPEHDFFGFIFSAETKRPPNYYKNYFLPTQKQPRRRQHMKVVGAIIPYDAISPYLHAPLHYMPLSTVKVRWRSHRRNTNYKPDGLYVYLSQFGAVSRVYQISNNSALVVFVNILSAMDVVKSQCLGCPWDPLFAEWLEPQMNNRKYFTQNVDLEESLDATQLQQDRHF